MADCDLRYDFPGCGFVSPGALAFRVGSRDAELLAPEFHVGTLDAGLMYAPENRPVVAGDLVSQEPFTAWVRRRVDRFHIFAKPKQYETLGTGELIRVQSRQRFGRARGLIEKRG